MVANELISYFRTLEDAKKFATIMCLPHIHHFETKTKPRLSKGSIFGSSNEEFSSKKG